MGYDSNKGILNQCVSANYKIIEKSNSGKLPFVDYYVFQVTSYVESLAMSDDLYPRISVDKIFLMRCIIECLAIIKMCIDGDIPPESKELIYYFPIVVEEKLSKKYSNIKVWNEVEVSKGYKLVKKLYREKMNGMSHSKFEGVLRSKLPFLLENYKYEDIIKKYLPDFCGVYKLFSIIIHPNDLSVSLDRLKIKSYDSLINGFLKEVSIALNRLNYSTSIVEKNIANNFRYKMGIFNDSNQEAKSYLLCSSDQKKALDNIGELIEELTSNNPISIGLKELGASILGLANDRLLGITEVIACKIKYIFELCAYINYLISLCYDDNQLELMELANIHTEIQLSTYDNNVSLEKEEFKIIFMNLLKAFKIYSRIENISFDSFLKQFMKSTGFSSFNSITEFVYKMIDDVEKNEEKREYMKLMYDESQMVSHANGYILFGSRSVFYNFINCISITDKIVIYMLEHYAFLWENSSMKEKIPSDFLERLNDNIKIIKDKMHEKYNIDYEWIFSNLNEKLFRIV